MDNHISILPFQLQTTAGKTARSNNNARDEPYWIPRQQVQPLFPQQVIPQQVQQIEAENNDGDEIVIHFSDNNDFIKKNIQDASNPEKYIRLIVDAETEYMDSIFAQLMQLGDNLDDHLAAVFKGFSAANPGHGNRGVSSPDEGLAAFLGLNNDDLNNSDILPAHIPQNGSSLEHPQQQSVDLYTSNLFPFVSNSSGTSPVQISQNVSSSEHPQQQGVDFVSDLVPVDLDKEQKLSTWIENKINQDLTRRETKEVKILAGNLQQELAGNLQQELAELEELADIIQKKVRSIEYFQTFPKQNYHNYISSQMEYVGFKKMYVSDKIPQISFTISPVIIKIQKHIINNNWKVNSEFEVKITEEYEQNFKKNQQQPLHDHKMKTRLKDYDTRTGRQFKNDLSENDCNQGIIILRNIIENDKTKKFSKRVINKYWDQQTVQDIDEWAFHYFNGKYFWKVAFQPKINKINKPTISLHSKHHPLFVLLFPGIALSELKTFCTFKMNIKNILMGKEGATTFKFQYYNQEFEFRTELLEPETLGFTWNGVELQYHKADLTIVQLVEEQIMGIPQYLENNVLFVRFIANLIRASGRNLKNIIRKRAQGNLPPLPNVFTLESENDTHSIYKPWIKANE